MKVVIYGNGDFAQLLHYWLKIDSKYEVVAFCADSNHITTKSINKLPLIGFEDIQTIFSPKEHMMFVAVGYSCMRTRITMYNKAKAKGYKLPNYISSQAKIVKLNSIGENNIILQNTIVEPFVNIGSNNILWSSVIISHNVTISDHSFFASQSLIGGNTSITDNCFIGFNATVINNVVIANETLIGAKSFINCSTQPFGKYIGTPCKLVSTHEANGIKIQ